MQVTRRMITPDEFYNDIMALCNMVGQEGYDCLYGIPRGGMVVAVYMSHILNIPVADMLDLIQYSHPLIVDDISDTGTTLRTLLNLGHDTATLYIKPKTTFVPDFYVKSFTGVWVVFPWEQIDEIPNRPIT